VSINGKEVNVIRPKVALEEPPFKTRYFAPANLRAAAEDAKYMELVNHFIAQRYTLRYSGGLVPDVVHALVKGHGIYISPVTGVSKAKLRRAFELAPIALIIECAGGSALDEHGTRILDHVIKSLDERGGLICGTKEEVEIVRKLLHTGGNSESA
jgi:sedoheptulose-bisphosphatase